MTPTDIIGALERVAATRPGPLFTWVDDAGRDVASLDTADLLARVEALTGHLVRRCGLRPGQPVLLAYLPSLDFVEAFLASIAAGLVPVPVYPPDPRRLESDLAGLRGIVERTGATAVLTHGPYQRATQLDGALRLLRGARVKWPDLAWHRTDVRPREAAAIHRPSPDDVAFLQFTSGSTSAPKGVRITHANVAHQLEFNRRALGLDADSRGVLWVPQYHDFGLISGILSAAWGNASLHVMSPMSFVRRPSVWFDVIHRVRGTHVASPNFGYALLLKKSTPEERAGWDLSSLRVMMSAAEPIDARLMERFLDAFAVSRLRRDAFCPAYGLAEHTVGVTVAGRQVLRADRARLERERRFVPREGELDDPAVRPLVGCGPVAEDIAVRIVDPETRCVVPPGHVGEIWVDSPSKADGYHGLPDVSREMFHASIAGEGGAWLRTGDLGLLHDGELFVTGRRKELIILAGRNLYPDDIEADLRGAHPSIRSGGLAAFAVTVPGEVGDRLVVAVEATAAKVGQGEARAIVDAVRRTVARSRGLVCHAVVLCPPRSLPKTTSGKLRRGELRARWEDGRLAAAAVFVDLLSGASEVEDAPAYLQGAVGAEGGDTGGHVSGDGRDTSHDVSVAATSPEADDALAATLRRHAARVMGLPERAIDSRAPLAEQGLSSVVAVELAAELSTALGREVPVALLFDHPSLRELAAALQGGDDPARVPAAAPDEPIAIVSMACRLPGGVVDPDGLWALLAAGVDTITEVPKTRWDVAGRYDPDPDAPGGTWSRWGGFVGDVSVFDAEFFGIGAREAESLDPQGRLLLETAWEAFERAGLTPEALHRSRTGVYVGISGNEYLGEAMADEDHVGPYALLGAAHSTVVGRLSYWLGLEGPNLPVDTACSSSLVALHLACQGLRDGDCDRALVGGVNLLLSPAGHLAFTRLRALSPTGRCRAFSADADGYVRAEGCGVVVLQRLSDALRDGAEILAVIRGSAVNQDGRSNGLTAPNGRAQRAVVREALARAGVDPGSVDVVECHGTGTPIGDPIEVRALGDVYGRRERPLYVGSVKSVVGHTEAAAGVTGLMKAVLALRHGEIPRTLHVGRPNPAIPWEELNVRPATEALPWPRGAEPRRISVSSFGFSGTNAHVVLEEAPPAPDGGTVTPPAVLPILLSARTEAAVRAQAGRLAEHVRKAEGLAAGSSAAVDIAATLASRAHFPVRLALPALDVEALDAVAAGLLPRGAHLAVTTEGARLAVLFTGQGSQRPGMGLALRGRPGLEVYTQALDAAMAACDAHLGGSPGARLADAMADERVHDTRYAQPALFALETALYRQALAWGARPDVLIGHSVGEIVAAHVAGVLSLDDAAALVVARGRLMATHARAGGAMAAVEASEAEVRALLGDGVEIAAINGPTAVVVSGDPAAVDALLARLPGRRTRLTTSHAFHSAHLDGMLAAFGEVAAGLRYGEAQVPVISTRTGARAGAELATAEHWVRQVREPVRFADAVRAAAADTFLECGPDADLSARVPAIVEAAVVPTLRRAQDEADALAGALGALWCQGHAAPRLPGRRIELPTYPFQREHHWHAPPRRAAIEPGRLPVRHVALREGGHLFELPVGVGRQPELADHVIEGRLVVAGAWQLAAVLAALQVVWPDTPVALDDVVFLAPLVLPSAATERRLYVELHPAARGADRHAVEVRGDDGTVHCTATLTLHVAPAAATPPEAPTDAPTALFDAFEGTPVRLGPSWRRATALAVEGDRAVLRVEGPAHEPVPGPLLDAAITLPAVLFARPADGLPRLPFAIGRLAWSGAPLASATLVERADRGASTDDMRVVHATFFGDDGRAALTLERVTLRRADLRPPAPTLLGLALRPVGEAAVAGTPVPGATPAATPASVPGDPADPAEPWLPGEPCPVGHARLDLAAVDTPTLLGMLAHLGARRLTVVAPGATTDPVLAARWGLVRAARAEHPGTAVTLVDPAGLPALPAGLPALPAALPAGVELRVADGALHALRVEPLPAATTRRPLDPSRPVLLTGGTGALGRVIARHLVTHHGARHLVLASRRGADAPDAGALAHELAALGARVELRAVDLADSAAVAALVAEVDPGAVIHAAGVLRDRRLAELAAADLAAVAAPKLDAALALDAATRGRALTHFVLFSSVAGLFGNAGQGAYAAANAGLDAIATRRHADGLPATSIVWGPWGEVGMAAELPEAERIRIERAGVPFLATAEALALFDAALDAAAPVVIAARVDRDALARQGGHPLLAASTRPRAAAGALDRALAGVAPKERERVVAGLVVGEVARVLGRTPDRVRPDQPLQEAGFDSLMAVELRNRLSEAAGVELPATLVFDHPTPAALTRLLLDRVAPAAPTARPRAASNEPIAIVSAACRLPGGVEDLDGLWALLEEGRDAVGEVPAARFPVDRWYDPDPEAVGRTISRWGGFLGDVERFDAAFFGIAGREAVSIDPQQRLLLETTWEVIERAGLTPAQLDGSLTGVYVGISGGEYQVRALSDPARIDAWSYLGTAHSAVAGRLSYWLGLRGPNLPVDTACSSSLVALHLACQALRAGECDQALAGGVNLLLEPHTFVYFSRLRALSPTGRCHTFSADADGYVRGEGCGVVLLKRLSDARRDGDRVLAVIRGTAVNQDGRSNGFTAPNGPAQQAVIRAALAQADLAPDSVDAVECHGTGTPLGDPIEVQALAAVYGEARPADRPVTISSLKSYVGHTEAAAGIAGVLKAVVSLQRRAHPRALHFSAPNPRIDWARLNVRVPTETRSWEADGHPRRIGVSSFGFSGTNAHVILEEAPPAPEPTPAPPLAVVAPLVLSARTDAALRAQAARLAAFVREKAPVTADVAYTLATRPAFERRVAIPATGDVAAALSEVARGELPAGGVRATARPGPTVFLFPGHGSQWPGMGRQLYAALPAFAEALDRCDAALRPLTGESVREVLLAGTPLRGEAIQHAVYAVGVALAAAWRDVGVRPDVVVGHSMGEITAAVVAGCLSVEDGARVVAARAALTARVGGAMLAVEAPEAELARRIAGRPLTVGAVNGPTSVVVSGDEAAIEALAAELGAAGVTARRVPIEYASHSAHTDPILPELAARVAGIAPRAGEATFRSTVTGGDLDGAALDAAYWCRNLREPVRFAAAIEGLGGIVVEVAGHAVLAGAVPGGRAVPTLQRGQGGPARFAQAVGAFQAHGGVVDVARVYGGRRVDLPTYAFQRERYWLAPVESAHPAALGLDAGGHPWLGAATSLADGSLLLTGRVSPAAHPWLRDHVVHGQVILPGTGLLELALAGARAAGLSGLRELALRAPVRLSGDVRVQVRVGPAAGDGTRSVSVASRDAARDGEGAGAWTVHAEGRAGTGGAGETAGGGALPSKAATMPAEAGALPADGDAIDVEALYSTAREAGLAYGPGFRRLVAARRRDGVAYGRVEGGDAESDRAAWCVHPALADAALHLSFAERVAGVPVLWTDVTLHRPASGPLTVVLAPERGGASLRLADARGPVLTVGRVEAMPVTAMQVAGRPGTAAGLPGTAAGLPGTAAGMPGGARDLLRVAWREVARGGQGERGTTAARTGTGPPLRLGDPRSPLAGVLPDGVAAPADLPGPVGRLVIDATGDRGDAVAAAVAALEQVRTLTGDPRLAGASLVWVTRRALSTSPGEDVDPAVAPLLGLLRVARNELGRDLRVVDLGDGTDGLRDALRTDEPELAVRGGRVLAPRLVPATAGGGVRLDPERTVLITGGTGDLGRAVAAHLATRGVRRFVLTGRRAPVVDPAPAILAAGAASVRVVSCDVADADAARALVDGIPDLGAVLHLAGVTDDAALGATTAERLTAVLRPKVMGAAHLHAATQGRDLSAFVLFSSASGLLGNPGQAAYAAANTFLDALAAHRRARGLPGQSVAWGAWAPEVGGMTGRLDPAVLPRMAARGLPALPVADALQLLDAALACDDALVAPLRVDPARLRGPAAPPILAEVVAGAVDGDDPAAVPTGDPLLDLRGEARRAALVEAVCAEAGRALGFDSIEADQPLRELGIDSLMGFDLRNRLAARTGLELPLAVIFEAATAERIAAWLHENLPAGPAPASAPGEAKVSPVAPTSPAAAASPTAPSAATSPVSPTGRATESQRAFFEQDALLPGAFQNLYAYRLPPGLDAEVLADALDALARRFDGLRCVRTADGGDVRDVLDPSALADVRAPAPLVDLPAQLAAAAEERLDLAATPVRWRLWRSDRESVLVQQISHVTYDGATLTRLHRGLERELQAFATGLGDRPPPAEPDPAYLRAERAYLGSAAHGEDRAWWEAEGRRLPTDLAADFAAPLRQLPLEPVGSDAVLRAAAQRHGVSPNALFLWAFCEAAAVDLGTDAFQVGFAVDLRALHGIDSPIACAVQAVPIGWERGVSPAEIHRRAVAAMARARLPNREIRERCGMRHIHPAVMFFSYRDLPVTPRPRALVPPALPVERVDTAALPVVRPHVVQAFGHLVQDALVLDGRQRGGGHLVPHLRETLARLGAP